MKPKKISWNKLELMLLLTVKILKQLLMQLSPMLRLKSLLKRQKLLKSLQMPKRL